MALSLSLSRLLLALFSLRVRPPAWFRRPTGHVPRRRPLGLQAPPGPKSSNSSTQSPAQLAPATSIIVQTEWDNSLLPGVPRPSRPSCTTCTNLAQAPSIHDGPSHLCSFCSRSILAGFRPRSPSIARPPILIRSENSAASPREGEGISQR